MAHISAILTAAGESTRMGYPKPLLLWHGLPLIKYQTSNLADAGIDQIIVVLGHGHELVLPHISGKKVQHVLNPYHHHGKTTSIKAGLLAVNPNTTAILLIGVDQPRPAHIISEISNSHIQRNALITSPTHSGHNGHPLIFSTSLLEELNSITEERQGIREVLRTHIHEVNEVPIQESIILVDINDPRVYEKARAEYKA